VTASAPPCDDARRRGKGGQAGCDDWARFPAGCRGFLPGRRALSLFCLKAEVVGRPRFSRKAIVLEAEASRERLARFETLRPMLGWSTAVSSGVGNQHLGSLCG
jgi:hypothetical protein